MVHEKEREAQNDGDGGVDIFRPNAMPPGSCSLNSSGVQYTTPATNALNALKSDIDLGKMVHDAEQSDDSPFKARVQEGVPIPAS